MTPSQILFTVMIGSFAFASICALRLVLNAFSGGAAVARVLTVLTIISYAGAVVSGLGLVYITLGHIA